MPEEQPLQRLTPLQLIFEPENIIFVGELEEIEKFGACFHNWEGGRLVVVDEDRDAAVGVEAEEPFFLLVVGHDVAVGKRGSLVGRWGL